MHRGAVPDLFLQMHLASPHVHVTYRAARRRDDASNPRSCPWMGSGGSMSASRSEACAGRRVGRDAGQSWRQTTWVVEGTVPWTPFTHD